MKITQVQVEPIPGFDVDNVSLEELNEYGDWLWDLGLNEVIVNYNGLAMHYRTMEERRQWLMGFECMRSILSS